MKEARRGRRAQSVKQSHLEANIKQASPVGHGGCLRFTVPMAAGENGRQTEAGPDSKGSLCPGEVLSWGAQGNRICWSGSFTSLRLILSIHSATTVAAVSFSWTITLL